MSSEMFGPNSQWAVMRDGYGTLDAFVRDSYLNGKPPFKTGLTELDRITGGLRPGLSVLGGEPGSGKSALALQMAVMSAYRGCGAVYFSLEMGYPQCISRALSLVSTFKGLGLEPFAWSRTHEGAAQSRAMLEDAKRHSTEGEAVEQLTNGGDAVMTAVQKAREKLYPLMIVCAEYAHGIEAIEQITRRAAELGASFAVIDYLQIVGVDGCGTEYERVGQVSGRLNALGNECGIPVLALSSVSREGAKSPSMHAYRGSGQVEFDANMALLLTGGDGEDARIHVTKNRHGAVTGEKPVALRFDREHNRFDCL